jgi:hypothetical protein
VSGLESRLVANSERVRMIRAKDAVTVADQPAKHDVSSFTIAGFLGVAS